MAIVEPEDRIGSVAPLDGGTAPTVTPTDPATVPSAGVTLPRSPNPRNMPFDAQLSAIRMTFRVTYIGRVGTIDTTENGART